jgi:hypothetical protein
MVETRRGVLLAVREQARLLLQDSLRSTSGRTRPWSPEQWLEAFTFLVSPQPCRPAALPRCRRLLCPPLPPPPPTHPHPLHCSCWRTRA